MTIRIKLTTDYPDWPLVRQTPGRSGRWDNCQFYVNQDVEECDLWVVMSGLMKREESRCPRENTILITGEPPTVKIYENRFLAQFSTVVTCHRGLNHPNVLQSHLALPWRIGVDIIGGRVGSVFSKDYDELKSIEPPQKRKHISVVTSSKAYTSGHARRVNFVKKLKSYFGERLDVYGAGINEIPDKWDALADYRYHIALENSVVRDYWTEKLADPYLAWTYPFYYGCPNISDYFPSDSLTVIDIDDFGGTVRLIEEAMASLRYDYSTESIREARGLVLDKHNVFALVAEFCHARMRSGTAERVVLVPEKAFEGSSSRRWKTYVEMFRRCMR